MDSPVSDRESVLSATLESLPGLFSSADDGLSNGYYFSEISHALSVLQGLNQQRKGHVLCDVIICVDDHEFPCHRNVLAACSPYFLAMFTGEMKESLEQRVTITGIDPSIMKELIDFAYTSDIAITQDNAQHLLSAANMVQINSIRDACCNFLQKEMDPTNCLGIHMFAEAHVCTTLSEKALTFALEHFTAVAQHEEILLLPQDKLVEIISTDQLNVEHEETVFQAVIDWVKHDSGQRLPKLASVLQHVRLPLVNPYFLFDAVENEPYLIESVECRALIDEAKKYYVLKDRHTEMQSCRTRPRHVQAKTNLIIAIGGEIHNKNYLNSVDCYNVEQEKWIRLKELTFPRCHLACTVSNGNNIYVSGGFNKDKQVLDAVLRYEPNLDKWIKVAVMTTPRARHGMAALDGFVYVMGGYDGLSRIASVERYSPVTNTWTRVEPMPVGLSRCQAVGLKGYLYVAGGTCEPSNQCSDLLQRYNPRCDSWESLSPMPVSRCLGGFLAIRGKLFAVGGTEEMVRASQRLTMYDPSHDCWRELAQIVEPRFDAGVATIGNKIYILSGHDGENSFYHSMEEYDIDLDQWTVMAVTSLPYGRCRFGCVSLGVPAMKT